MKSFHKLNIGSVTGYEPDIIALGFQELVELSPQQIVRPHVLHLLCFHDGSPSDMSIVS